MPCARLLGSDAIPVAMGDRLRAALGTLDPLAFFFYGSGRCGWCWTTNASMTRSG